MFVLLVSFIISCLCVAFLLRWKKFHLSWSADYNTDPQKIHSGSVPRIGGFAIFFGILVGSILKFFSDKQIGYMLTAVIVAALPIFLVGFIEDITKKINFRWRFLFSFVSGFLFIIFFDIDHIYVDVSLFDFILQYSFFSIIFLVIAISGLCNSYNIIDGINGLASMVGVLTLLAILYVSFKVGDTTIISFAMIGIGSIIGFFIWNYPKGLIFLGDGGAYLIGFWISSSVILLIVRNPSISPWFALLINAYPVFETLFTIWRRSIHKSRKVMMPDGAHFHSLIYRRIMRWTCPNLNEGNSYLSNSKTSPYLWIFSSIGLFPAVLFWNSSEILIASCAFFVLLYIYLYRKIVLFKTPAWIIKRSTIPK
jgi:UDP-GlcNAc:undecaprenyl-phosphate GlcNAc-1-phosphate transferase